MLNYVKHELFLVRFKIGTKSQTQCEVTDMSGELYVLLKQIYHALCYFQGHMHTISLV